MHCTEAKYRLDMTGGLELDVDDELTVHLKHCAGCDDYYRELRLSRLLASLPVREPEAGFEERAVLNIPDRRPYPVHVHVRWALAVAASVLLSVLLTMHFYSAVTPSDPKEAALAAVVELQPKETRVMDILLSSPRYLDNALITVELDENLALEGYSDVRQLQWHAALKNGDNSLSLPIQLLRGESGNITVTVEHANASKRLSILVNAAPDRAGRKLSMVI